MQTAAQLVRDAWVHLGLRDPTSKTNLRYPYNNVIFPMQLSAVCIVGMLHLRAHSNHKHSTIDMICMLYTYDISQILHINMNAAIVLLNP